MERVERAISEGRCVFVFGGRSLQDAEVLGELRRRSGVPSAILSGEPRSPAGNVTADCLAPALSKEGGVICLVEAESEDSMGMEKLANIVAGAAHKPRLVVVARAFNPFALPSALRTLKFEHEKKKARDFLFPLPVSAAAPAPVATTRPTAGTLRGALGALSTPEPVTAPAEDKKTQKATSGAPRAAFVGREEELAAFKDHLDAGGPVLLSGPHGVGRRWLTEKALSSLTSPSGQPYRRFPDFVIGRGAEADALYARIAQIAGEAGDKRLGDALREPSKRPVPAELAALAVESLGNSALENSVLVVDHLEFALRGDGTFHREGRLELLLKAMLLGRYKMRVVFMSTLRVRFYREGEGVHLPVMELGGLKGRELHEVFDAWRVENFPREHFGDIINRIHGHPFATRMFAIAMRDPEHRDDLMENRRFFQMENIRTLEPLARRVAKSMESLTDEERKALYGLAHFRLPFTAAEMELVEVDRKMRLSLAAKGLLDQTPDDVKDRLFSIHPLVLAHIDPRERAEFPLFEKLGEAYLERARGKDADVYQKLAWNQEGNRLLFEAHRIRNRARMPYPDHDPLLESVRGLVRSKKPRFDLAEQRLIEAIGLDSANTELKLMLAELKIAVRANPDAIGGLYQEIQKATPTPEAFHTEATWHQHRNAGRGRAAGALERGIVAFPESGRMRRRLAGFYLDQNRTDDAIEQLQEAMRLEPMMPDTYGMLGELYLVKGPNYFDQAEQSLEEARRLDPENGLHMARLGALIFERGNPERLHAAEELLKSAVELDKKNYLAHLYLARLIAQKPESQESDLERANWLLKQASKLDERAALPLVEMALISVRRENWADASGLLDKADRLDRACHEAMYARATMYEKQGHIFNADPLYRRAFELSPPETNARTRYKEAIDRVTNLITTGVALELQKQAEAAGIPAPAVQETKPVSQRTTVRRRGGDRGRKGKGTGDGETAEVSDAQVEGTEGSEPQGEDAQEHENQSDEAQEVSASFDEEALAETEPVSEETPAEAEPAEAGDSSSTSESAE